MAITSFYFLLLVTVGAIVYYIIPKKWQWVELLLLSLVYYYYAGTPYTIIYLVISMLTAYISTLIMEKAKSKTNLVLAATVLALLINIGIWFALKGKGLWGYALSVIQNHVAVPWVNRLLNIQIISALGMGYYTLQILGYIIDCYWKNIEPQKNPLKLLLFTVYFPQLTNGPISRYSQLNILYEKHNFTYQNITFGAQRILWGFVKKLVLAERMGGLINALAADPVTYHALYSWLIILLYPLQIYADFSGCMDIVLGVSELFDIHLAENFNSPFFSRTSQEFWQRWHITLGTWAKDYVLYPLLKLSGMVKLGKWLKKKYGKKTGKFLVNALGMFVLWMVMGIWHGGIRYIIGVSLWYWMILMAGNLLAPTFAKLASFFNMKTDSFSWHFFQSARTYLIFSFGAVLFGQGIKKGLEILWDAGRIFRISGYINPWILFDGSILNTGITYGDINIMILCLLMLLIVGVLREKYVYARIWIQGQSFVFRWSIWICLFILVIVYGKYGLGYEAGQFIYQGF